MNNNPFFNTQGLNLPLEREICQRIHYTALRSAASGRHPEELPATLPVAELQEQAHYWGNEVYLAHPADIVLIFNGVTLPIYQKIKELYCSRLNRSIPMVHQILGQMAAEASAPSLTYEAVWAICLYLEERRQENIEVTLEPTEMEWQLIQLRPPIRISDLNDQLLSPVLLCMIDRQRSIVISFRFTHESKVSEAAGLVIYDAFIAQRSPSPEGATGLSWTVPAVIDAHLNLPQTIQKTLHQVEVRISSVNRKLTLPDSLINWGSSLSGRVLKQQEVVRMFDFYLHQTFGHGPLRLQRNLTYKFSHLTGYSKDPAWQFPALRQLLPEHKSIISAEGQVKYDGLHYQDTLLNYWPGQSVSLRRSEHAEATAWIYLNRDILCLAVARELLKKDGTYRLNRPGRG